MDFMYIKTGSGEGVVLGGNARARNAFWDSVLVKKLILLCALESECTWSLRYL